MKATAGLLLLIAHCLAATSRLPAEALQVYVTAKDTEQRLTRVADLSLAARDHPTEKQPYVFVDPAKTFQTVLGIGGALTDAAAETYYKLPKEAQREIITAYFDPEKGIGYSLGRTHINSCDFSSRMYTYVDAGDAALKSFNVAPDRAHRIPFIREALTRAGKQFTLYASPWSPPAWMKDNNNMLRGGKLKPEFHRSWANYYVAFIKAYEAEGIPIWGVTVQNEPMAAQKWESCIYTAEEERDFVKNHLGPTFAAAGMSQKIVIWDHNRTLMYQRAKVALDDPEAARFIWGIGYHWYMNDSFENVKRVHEAFPQTNLLFTEGCGYPYSTAGMSEWKWGEQYGKSMVNDFNNGAVGWTDWNVLLDEQGGPNHVNNFCFAPVHGDTTTGRLHYMNSFYYIGHFSKFVRPGARRIVSSSTTDTLLTTAFLNTDGSTVIVVMNETEKDQDYLVWIGDRFAAAKSPAHSIMTLVRR